MFKKLLTAALCLTLALCLCVPAFAAEKRNATFYGQNPETESYDNPVYGMTAVGDTLYILVSDRIDRWTPDMDAPEPFIEGINPNRYSDERGDPEEDTRLKVSTLFTDGEQLYGMTIINGDMYLLVDADGAKVQQKLCTLDVKDLNYVGPDYTACASIYNMFIQDGAIYSLMMVDNGEIGSMVLISFDLATGEKKELGKGEDAIALSRYKDGKLLLHAQNALGSYDEEKNEMRPSQLYALNPADGARELICDVPMGINDSIGASSARYLPATDEVIYIEGSTVYTMPAAGGEARISAYLPNNVWQGDGNGTAVLASGMLAQGSYEGLNIRGLDMPGVEKGALIVAGEYGSDQHRAALAANPEMNVAMSEGWLSGMEAITNAMLSDSGAIDVIKLDSSYSPIDKLIAKGYAMCLSDYPDIKAVTDMMDERFIAPYTRDGKVYAIPTSLYANTIGYRPDVLEQLGLTEDDLPKTYPELFDFMANFMYDYGEDNPDISLFDDMNTRQQLLNRYQNDYTAWQLNTTGTIAFDTPVFRDALKAMAAIDYAEFDPYEQYGEDVWNDNDAMNEFWRRSSLFTLYSNATSPSVFRSNTNFRPLLLAIDEGEAPMITATVDLIMINPKTTRADEAAAYVAAYISNINDEQALSFFPDTAQPIVNNSYERDRASLESYIAEREKALETAAEENKASIREEVEALQKELDGYEQFKYSVSAEMLDAFNTYIRPYLTPAKQTPLTDYSNSEGNQFWNMTEQYRSGAIDLDKYVREMDNRIRMMMLEDQ